MSNSRLLDRHLNNNICPDLKKGDRIVLIRMSDPISPVPPKSRGTVLKDGTSFLDEQIYSIRWDKAGSLNILSNIDTLKDLDRKIERSNDESEIEKYKQIIKNIESDHDVWMFEEDFDNLKNKVKSITEGSKGIVNILKKNKGRFKNFDIPKLIKYLTSIRDASFVNMLQSGIYLITGKDRVEHDSKYKGIANKKALQYAIDNADEVRDIMIRGAMSKLEDLDQEITPQSVEREMRRAANDIMSLYITLPLKQQDYPEYDDMDSDDDYEDEYEDEDDDY